MRLLVRVAYGWTVCGFVMAFGKDPKGAKLAELKSPDPEVRIAALRELQTSDDPRLPDAMLQLLQDEGNSIRRLATRGVGSRWWQIPSKRVPTFVGALKHNEGNEFEDEQWMIKRALGLLHRTYDSEIFSVSPNKRWVIYERRNFPCLIDTTTHTEEMLGWTDDDHRHPLFRIWGNGPLAPYIFWHPTKEWAAIDMTLGRHETTLWVWRHHSGVRKLEPKEIARLFATRGKSPAFGNGFYVEEPHWVGNELQFDVTFENEAGGKVGWNAAKNSLRVISKAE